MWALYDTVANDHDLRFVALALLICALGTTTGAAIVQHSIVAIKTADRFGWLLLAGVVTALAIWATHFTAMLGYRRDLDIRYDLTVAAISLSLCVLLTLVGGLLGPLRGDRTRGILGGLFVGLAIAVAHFLDMAAMRVHGTIHHDHWISAAAIMVGLGLAGLSGRLLILGRNRAFPWPAMLAMFCAVVSLHFMAMSGVTIELASSATATNGDASTEQLAAVVAAAFIVILMAAIGYTWHSATVARATAEEQRRLIEALQELRTTKDHHRAYVELSPQIAWVADPQGAVTEIAPLWSRIVGIPRENGLGYGWLDAMHPDDRAAVLERWQEALATKDAAIADARYRVKVADGSYKWFRARSSPRMDDEGNVLAWYGSLEDIHDQVLAEERLRASEERYRLASRATNDVIWDWSFDTRRATWAGAHQLVLNYPELDGETDLAWWQTRIHPEDVSRVNASLKAALSSGADHWQEEYRFKVASGDWIDIRTRCVIVRDAEGEPKRLVGSMLDITQQKQAEAELNWAAYHDPLTKLPNRSLYGKRKRAAIAKASTSGCCVALIVLDLNKFKQLNDTLGHPAGDKVLVEAAQRLSQVIPEGATLARLGGDEFAIVLPELAHANDYREFMAALSVSLSEPVEFGEMRLSVSYSAGVAVWPRDGDDPGELLIAADLALYEAKTGLPGTVREFVPEMRAASEKRSRMLSLARDALESDRIVPFYQPKIELRTGKIMGWEALLRLRADDGALLPPSTIAAAFEDAGTSVQLTDRMFERVFSDLAGWRSKGVDPGRIAINVSEGDFRHHDLTERLRAKLMGMEDCFSTLDVEVTETVLVSQLGPEIARILDELRSLGVQVALDDFGTGYASLTHLQQFPVDAIKIDRTFIARIDESDEKATAVIDAILQMARRLGMMTVAEGVDSFQQARYLLVRGCSIGQGYFFSPAVPAAEVEAMLAGETFTRWAVPS